MRSVFISRRGGDAIDISSEEMEHMNRNMVEIDEESLEEVINTLCGEQSREEILLQVLQTYSDACHENEETGFISSLSRDSVQLLVGGLTSTLEFSIDKQRSDLTVLSLKCLTNTAYIHEIGNFILQDDRLRLVLRQTLFSNNFQERQMSVVLFSNMHVDMNLADKAAAEEYFCAREFLHPDSLSETMTCGRPYARRYFKDLVDLIPQMTFPVHDIVTFFMNVLISEPPDHFSRHILRALLEILRRFRVDLYCARNSILEWTFRDYSELIRKFTGSGSKVLAATFLEFFGAFVDCITDEIRTRFVLENDIIYDIEQFFPHPMGREEKAAVVSIIEQCQEVNSSLFESPNVPKSQTYAYLIQCLCPETFELIMLSLLGCSADIARNSPVSMQRLFYELDNFLLNDETFRENSTFPSRIEYQSAISAISLLEATVEQNSKLRKDILERRALVSWLQELGQVDFGNCMDINEILGEVM